MKALQLAIVSPYPPSKGTLNEYAYHLVRQLELKEDVESIFLLTDDIEEAYPEDTAKRKFIPAWKFNSIGNVFRIAKAVKKSGANAVLYNIQFLSFGDNKIAATIGLFTPLLTRLMGVPSIVLLHNITETVDYSSAGITDNRVLQWIYSAFGTIITFILLRANMLAVTLPKYVDILERKYKAKNVALIPHGSFELPPLPTFEEHDNEQLTVMTFGKFGTYKKVENLIEAVVKVRKKTGKQIKLVIAGTDNPNVAGYLKSVQQNYHDVSNIVFTGYVEEEDVPILFNDSSFVVFDYTSTTGSSGVLHQAGSYGKAAALPVIGDLKELIEEEGYTGEFFKPNDIEDLSRAIEILVEDVNRRNQIAKQNYFAASSLSMEDIVDWYILHFQRFLTEHAEVTLAT